MIDRELIRRQMAERAADARRLSERIAAASASATSGDRAVSVTVGPGGAILELTLADRAMRYRGDDLGRLIVETIGEASSELERTLAAEISEFPGAPANLMSIVNGRLPAAPKLAENLPNDDRS